MVEVLAVLLLPLAALVCVGTLAVAFYRPQPKPSFQRTTTAEWDAITAAALERIEDEERTAT